MSHVCQVDFYNHLDDGSVVVGVLANFRYQDGTTSQSNDPGANLGYNGATSLYSEDKCVKSISAMLSVRRPSNELNVLQGSEPPAPANKCYVRSAFGAEPARMRGFEAAGEDTVPDITLVLFSPVRD